MIKNINIGGLLIYIIIISFWFAKLLFRSTRQKPPICHKSLIKVCQWLATGLWFSPGTLVSSTNKTIRHDITEILLKVTLNTTKHFNAIKQTIFVTVNIFSFFLNEKDHDFMVLVFSKISIKVSFTHKTHCYNIQSNPGPALEGAGDQCCSL